MGWIPWNESADGAPLQLGDDGGVSGGEWSITFPETWTNRINSHTKTHARLTLRRNIVVTVKHDFCVAPRIEGCRDAPELSSERKNLQSWLFLVMYIYTSYSPMN